MDSGNKPKANGKGDKPKDPAEKDIKVDYPCGSRIGSVDMTAYGALQDIFAGHDHELASMLEKDVVVKGPGVR